MAFSRELLIGQWYRTQTNEQGNLLTEYALISVDGSYEFTFIEHDAEGKIKDQVIEFGDWGLVGDIHFTIAKGEVINQEQYSADLANPNNYHAYKVIKLTNKEFIYQHVETNERYTLTRVSDNVAYC